MADDPEPVVIKAIAYSSTPEAIEFFKWLGMCVSTWAFIDRRLYQIFHHAIGLDQKQSAFLYYRNRAFNQRLRMVDDAVKMAFSKEVFDLEWRPLRDQVVNLSHTRNIFAHHPTMRVGTSQDRKPMDIYSISVEPYERALNNDYPGLRGKAALETADLYQHNIDAEQLESTLGTFAWRVGGLVVARKATEGSS
ncbi:MAG: hypothetical protein ACLPX7_02240 [Xanthobacteraceae bacterium]